MNLKIKSGIKTSRRNLRTLQNHLYAHVEALSTEIGPRNLQHHSALNRTCAYIAQQMKMSTHHFSAQPYQHQNNSIQNLILEQSGQNKPDEIIVIGAHYDTVLDSPGADDNATGVAGLLELIRMLHRYHNDRTFRFVAFTLEEPPFFGTEQMGSQVYAKSCKERNENIVAMIALEMLGFYTEKRGSQKYPLPDMQSHSAAKGNFISVVGNDQSRQLGNSFAEKLKETSLVKTETVIPSSPVYGIDLSDHGSFWKYNYPAIMITDTGFYRNPHYHETSDTIDKLNFRYFARLVYALAYALEQLDKKDLI